MNKKTVLLLKQTSSLILVMLALLAVFAGCRKEAAPPETDEKTETITDISEEETASEDIPEKEETVIDIPFYYMVFCVYDMYDFDTYNVGLMPFCLKIVTDTEDLQDSRVFNKTTVTTGYKKTSRISELMADRYTDEYFETHDLIFFYYEGDDYKDVLALQNTDRGTEMTLRCYGKAGLDWELTFMTLIEVPKGYVKSYPAIFRETVYEEDHLYQELEEERKEAERHHFPGGVMKDVEDWEPAVIPEKETAYAGIPEKE